MVVGDDHENFLVFVGASDAEVEEFAGVAHADFAVFVDCVVSGSPFFFGVVVGRGFGCGGVCLLWGASFQGAVGSGAVVVLAKLFEELLQLINGLCWGPGFDPFFEGLVEPLNFSLGLGVARPAVFLLDFVCDEYFFERVSPTFAPG